jgi:hypothetical protein
VPLYPILLPSFLVIWKDDKEYHKKRTIKGFELRKACMCPALNALRTYSKDKPMNSDLSAEKYTASQLMEFAISQPFEYMIKLSRMAFPLAEKIIKGGGVVVPPEGNGYTIDIYSIHTALLKVEEVRGGRARGKLIVPRVLSEKKSTEPYHLIETAELNVSPEIHLEKSDFYLVNLVSKVNCSLALKFPRQSQTLFIVRAKKINKLASTVENLVAGSLYAQASLSRLSKVKDLVNSIRTEYGFSFSIAQSNQNVIRHFLNETVVEIPASEVKYHARRLLRELGFNEEVDYEDLRRPPFWALPLEDIANMRVKDNEELKAFNMHLGALKGLSYYISVRESMR